MLYTKAEFKKAVSIWPKKYEAVPNCTILFRTTVSSGKNTILNIAGQSSYEVFINGEFVFHGPSRASHGFYRVDKLPIESYLTKDKNEISVLVSGYHCHSFYHVSELAAGHGCYFNFEINGSKASIKWNQEENDRLWMGYRDGENRLIIRNPNTISGEARPYTALAMGHPEGWNDAFRNNLMSMYRWIDGGMQESAPFASTIPIFPFGARWYIMC